MSVRAPYRDAASPPRTTKTLSTDLSIGAVSFIRFFCCVFIFSISISARVYFFFLLLLFVVFFYLFDYCDHRPPSTRFRHRPDANGECYRLFNGRCWFFFLLQIFLVWIFVIGRRWHRFISKSSFQGCARPFFFLLLLNQPICYVPRISVNRRGASDGYRRHQKVKKKKRGKKERAWANRWMDADERP